MRAMYLVMGAMLVAAHAVSGSILVRAAQTHSPVASPVGMSDCPITKPSSAAPDYWLDDVGFYGNGVLGTSLTMWSDEPGIVEVPNDGHIAPDGTVVDMKWAWHRFEKGRLAITGRRLDAPDDPLIAWIPDGYGQSGFQVSGLTFPSAGCWEITGKLNDSRLTFVVLVILPPDWTVEATPVPTISRWRGI